jgi:hypothetical protein
MSKNDWWKDLKERLKDFAMQVVSILIDSVFLALWVIAQWAVEYVIKRFGLSGIIDRLVLQAFQVIFAISTLAVVALYIYADISILYLRTQRKIQRERELSKASDSDNE